MKPLFDVLGSKATDFDRLVEALADASVVIHDRYAAEREREARIDEITQLIDLYKTIKEMLYKEIEKLGYGTSISIRAVENTLKYLNDRLAALKEPSNEA